MSATPLLDKATVARFVVEDFPLEPGELDALQSAAERHKLEDALREVVEFETVAAAAAGLWRERRAR